MKVISQFLAVALLSTMALLSTTTAEAEASDFASFYTCAIFANLPSNSFTLVQGKGEAWCGSGGQIVWGDSSKVCARRARAWWSDVDEHCKGFEILPGNYHVKTSNWGPQNGSKKYRTRMYARFDDLVCGCPTINWYAQSDWVQL